MVRLMKIIFTTMTLVIASQAHALSEAQLDEKCGPMPDAYKECSRSDDKCNEAALRRAVKIHECRMHALVIEAQMPIILPPVQWPSEAPSR